MEVRSANAQLVNRTEQDRKSGVETGSGIKSRGAGEMPYKKTDLELIVLVMRQMRLSLN